MNAFSILGVLFIFTNMIYKKGHAGGMYPLPLTIPYLVEV